MKKRLLVIMMSMVVGGLTALPKTAVHAKAEEQLPTPTEVHSRHVWFDNDGNLDIPWEWLTGTLPGTDVVVHTVASLDVAFYPTEEGFDPLETYAVVNYGSSHLQQGMKAADIVDALKEANSTFGIDYSPAVRYKSESADYVDSDWVDLLAKYPGNRDVMIHEFGYRLTNAGSIGVDDNLESGTYGRFVWAWEIWDGNPQSSEIDYLEVLVFSGDTETIDENSVPLTTFEVRRAEDYTHKADVERYLTLAGLPEGDYKFSARLVAVQGSEYGNSKLYPLTRACHYEPSVVTTETNIAFGCSTVTSSGNGGAAVDGLHSDDKRWIASASEDTSWLVIDFGAKFYLSKIDIHWERAYAKAFKVFVEDTLDVNTFDGNTTGMKALSNVSDRAEYKEHDEINANDASGRYLIISCLEKCPEKYPYSIYEVEVYANTKLTDVEKFILDWKELRANGKGDICTMRDSDEMTRLLEWYDSMSEEDRKAIDAQPDDSNVKSTIGDVIQYVKDIRNAESKVASNNGGLLFNSVIKDSKSIISIVAIFASITLVTVAYYFLNKKKHNN